MSDLMLQTWVAAAHRAAMAADWLKETISSDERGRGTAAYALIMALVSVVTIAILSSSLHKDVQNSLTNVQGHFYRPMR